MVPKSLYIIIDQKSVWPISRKLCNSQLCATLQEMQPATDDPMGLTYRAAQLSLPRRDFARSRTRMTVTVSLREVSDVAMLTTPMTAGTYTYTWAKVDRSKDTRCQNRPAFETIFGFGPDGTRIATSCSV